MKDSSPDKDESSVRSADSRIRRCNSRDETLNDGDWVSSCDTEDTTAAALLFTSDPSTTLSPVCRSSFSFLLFKIPSTVNEEGLDDDSVRTQRFDRGMEVDSETLVM